MAKSVIASIVLLSMLLTSCATQGVDEPKRKVQSPVSKYNQMNKEELQQQLIELHAKYLASVAERKEKKDQLNEAEREYCNASEEKKADALFRMLAKRAFSEQSDESSRNAWREFDDAQDAYVNLLRAEL